MSVVSEGRELRIKHSRDVGSSACLECLPSEDFKGVGHSHKQQYHSSGLSEARGALSPGQRAV